MLDVGSDLGLDQLDGEDAEDAGRLAGRTSSPDDAELGRLLERRQGGMGKGNEVQTWEACAKVVKKEREDFWEFAVSSPSPSCLPLEAALTTRFFLAAMQLLLCSRGLVCDGAATSGAGGAAVRAPCCSHWRRLVA